MATLTRFTPSPSSNFQFQPVLDGASYNAVVTWNYYGQRYYINIYTQQGVRVLSLPMVGSPDGYDISLTAGYFASTLVFRSSSQNIEVTP